MCPFIRKYTRHILPEPCDLDLWISDLKSAVSVTGAVDTDQLYLTFALCIQWRRQASSRG